MNQTKPSVLAVDDEPGILRLISLELSVQGFDVTTADSGERALASVEEHQPDIIVLDVMLPDASGLDLMKKLRSNANVPIILLTARGKHSDRAEGLDLGADDYLVKPFSPEELTARVRAVLRRWPEREASFVEIGDLRIDLDKRLVFRGDRPVSLTRTEWLLLEYLAEHPGKLVLNADLLGHVWGSEYRGDLQYLRVWISRLRKKLEENPSMPRVIRTVQGVGYVLATPDSSVGVTSEPEAEFEDEEAPA